MSNVKPKSPVPSVLSHSADDCEQVAKAIEAIGDAALKVISGPLTMNAICLLVRDQLPYGSKTRISLSDVQDVLEAAAGIGKHLVRKPSR